jgi:hypothetical protein
MLAMRAKLNGTFRQIPSPSEIRGYATVAKSVAKNKNVIAVCRQTAGCKNAPRRATLVRGLLLLLAAA